MLIRMSRWIWLYFDDLFIQYMFLNDYKRICFCANQKVFSFCLALILILISVVAIQILDKRMVEYWNLSEIGAYN